MQLEIMTYLKGISQCQSLLCSKLQLNFALQIEAIYLQLAHPGKEKDIALQMSLLHTSQHVRADI